MTPFLSPFRMAPQAVAFGEATNDAAVLQAKRLCYETYVSVGYLTPSPAAAFGPEREPGVTYIVATDARGTVVGTLRLSTHRPFQALAAWRGRLYHQQAALLAAARRGPAFGLGALAVRKACAPLKVAQGLYHFAYRWALAHSRDYGIITMDARAFRALGMAGWHAVPVGTPMHYLGSLTVPAIIPIREQSVLAARLGSDLDFFLQTHHS